MKMQYHTSVLVIFGVSPAALLLIRPSRPFPSTMDAAAKNMAVIQDKLLNGYLAAAEAAGDPYNHPKSLVVKHNLAGLKAQCRLSTAQKHALGISSDLSVAEVQVAALSELPGALASANPDANVVYLSYQGQHSEAHPEFEIVLLNRGFGNYELLAVEVHDKAQERGIYKAALTTLKTRYTIFINPDTVINDRFKGWVEKHGTVKDGFVVL